MSTTHRALRRAVDNVVAAEDALDKAQLHLALAEQRLGAALRESRIYAELSLRECAKELGVSAPYLSDVELGRRSITDSNLETLMGILIPLNRMKP